MRALVSVAVVALAVLGCGKHAKPVDPNANPWTLVGIGSVFESKTMTHMEKPFAHDTETTTTQTLLARTGTEATVKLEIAEGAKTSSSEIKIPFWHDAVKRHDGATVSSAQEKVTVPAGTFDCTKETVEVHQDEVTRSTTTWTAKRVPIPIKTVVTNENMTMTTELTKIIAGK